MKRLVIRLSILSVVVALGLFAIAQARHGSDADSRAVAARDDDAGGGDSARAASGKPSAESDGSGAHPLRGRDGVPGLPSRMGNLPPSRAGRGTDDEIPPAEVVLNGKSNRFADRYPDAAQDDTAPAKYREQDERQLAGERYSSSRGAVPVDDDVQDVSQARFDDDPAEQGGIRPTAHVQDEPQRIAPRAAANARRIQPVAATEEATGRVSPPAGSGSRDIEAPGRFPDAEEAGRLDPREPYPPATSRPGAGSSVMAGRPESAAPPNFPGAGPQLAPGGEAADDSLPQPHGGLILPPSHTPVAGEGNGRPGPQSMDGAQTPSLSVMKSAPQEVQVGKRSTFEVFVRNVGQVAAEDVEVIDVVPKGATLVGTNPRAAVTQDGEIVWKLGRLEPGAETTLQATLMPVAEGEIGSVARVRFAARASVRTISTRPELALRLTAAPQVMLGDDIRVGIELSNPGSGAADNVMLIANIPDGVTHPAGSALEFEVGTLAPGESRQLELTLNAVAAGRIVKTMVAQSDANLQVQDHVEFEVVSPQLAVDVEGPKRRYLERPATYTLSVSNPGTASAQNIELVTYLPKGMKFVKANNAGTYDPTTHSVIWGLEELPARQAGTVQVTAIPMEMGDQKLRVEGRASMGLADDAEQSVLVEGLAAVLFTVADVADPVEVGGETVYEVRVVNQGSKASTNVQVIVQMPPDMKAVSAAGPTRYQVEPGRVIFEPLGRLAPKADTTYQIKVQALRRGDQRVRVQLVSDEMQTPVTKEESTRVYADE